MLFLSYTYMYSIFLLFFFFNDTATTEIYTLSLHDALPISDAGSIPTGELKSIKGTPFDFTSAFRIGERINEDDQQLKFGKRSEEHTSELQSRSDLVCRLLLEKKKKRKRKHMIHV